MLSEEPFALLWAAPAKAWVIEELTVVAENVNWQERVPLDRKTPILCMGQRKCDVN